VISPPTIEALFYGGRHREVLAASVDSAAGDYDEAAVPFIVGSLVFSGRADEAATIFRAWERTAHQPALAELAAARFFLCVAECRAGRYLAAERLCAATLSDVKGREDPRLRFYLHQGVGLVRHFTGRIASARRHASRARRHALESRFPYGRMLALDLLGHALVQLGRVMAGLTALEQAVQLSETIGLRELSMTTRSAMVAYRALFGGNSTSAVTDLVAHLERLGDADRYSRRLVLTELARTHAYRGEARAALSALDEAERVALPDGDRRAKVKLYLARALLLGLARGEDAASEWLQHAAALVDANDDAALLVELAFHEYVVAPSAFSLRSPSSLRGLASKTGLARAEALAVAAFALAPGPPNEDRFAELLRLVRRGSPGLDPLLAAGFLGLLPTAMGRPPGTRIYVDRGRGFVAIEDHGNVKHAELPSDAVLDLLRAVAHGPRTKEELIRDVWRLNAYRPQQHDSVVHTAISRLRSVLEPCSSWVQATPAGYSLASGVELVETTGAGDICVATSAPLPTPDGKPDPRRALVLARITSREASTGEIAKLLGVSELTARRLLVSLLDEGSIERIGSGPKTRYVRRALTE